MNEQQTGLQLAVNLLAQIGNDESDRAISAVHDLAEEHAQRLTLQHHACDLAQRVADLEAERDNLVDAMREEIDEGLRLRELGGALQDENITAMTERVIKERDELRARLDAPQAWLAKYAKDWHTQGSQYAYTEATDPDASEDWTTEDVVKAFVAGAEIAERDAAAKLAEIEAQEPVAMVTVSVPHLRSIVVRDIPAARIPQPGTLLFTRPVPAQAVPDADGARFRWLCDDHSDRETREQCRSLIDRLSGMSYSAAVMSIDAAMAAAPEHKE